MLGHVEGIDALLRVGIDSPMGELGKRLGSGGVLDSYEIGNRIRNNSKMISMKRDMNGAHPTTFGCQI